MTNGEKCKKAKYMRDVLKIDNVIIELNAKTDGSPVISRILTPHLSIIPVTLNDNTESNKTIITQYISLFANPVTMQKFNKGRPWSTDFILEVLQTYNKEWRQGYPLSGFSVFNDKDEFIGNVTVEKTEDSESRGGGESLELYYIFKPEFWGKGYATEAISAVVNFYIPKVLEKNLKFDNQPIKELFATVRLDNIYSKKILDNIGFTTGSIASKFDSDRYCCSISANQLMISYQKVRKDENEEKSSSTSEASDITAEEMINSAFGRASNTVKNILKGKGAVTNESSQISL